MNTPIADFIRAYAESGTLRLHMPGHKGHPLVGCEAFDITEIRGADELAVADGIIGESERNASLLFGTGKTLFSTEGSSQCIRAMVYLAASAAPDREKRKYLLAGRNAHKTLLYALALADLDVQWLFGKADSLCSCPVTPAQLEQALDSRLDCLPVAVYITSPDYLGGMAEIGGLAEICHRYGVPLLVDNAHGAYLRFLPQDLHPISLGADLCCDSAHKTLPALTGAAYLHIGKNAPPRFAENAKQAMALFGSTSPSYLTLMSLDLCNARLACGFREKLLHTTESLNTVRQALRSAGWQTVGNEPMKLTVRCPEDLSGFALAGRLRDAGIECEYADRDFLVLMPSVETTDDQLSALTKAMGQNSLSYNDQSPALLPGGAEAVMTVRQAIFSPCETVAADDALGRICAAPTVSCPPAIPVVCSGERIGKEQLDLLRFYGISALSVVRE